MIPSPPVDLLLVTHRVPYPPDKGDRIRTFHLLKFLAGRARVHLAALADEPVPAETRRVLETLCRRVAIAPLGPGRWLRGIGSLLAGKSISEGVFHSEQLARTLRDWAGNTSFQAAVASASSVAPYLQQGEIAKVPAVVDLVDVDSQKWADYAAASRSPKSLIYRVEGRRLRRAEQTIAGWARAVTLVSEGEADLLRRGGLPDRSRVEAVTNGVDLEYFRPEPEAASVDDCVFVGAFDYRPNIDAACWFAREIWPEIAAGHPAARFRLVGRNPAKAVRQLSSIAGIDVVGTVPDVRPYVRQAAVVVAPLRIARGLQNKVLEALAMGKAVVASPQALAGFRGDVPAVRASNRSEWLTAVTDLMHDGAARRRLGNDGRAFAEEYHDWDRCLEPFWGLLAPANERHRLSESKGHEIHRSFADQAANPSDAGLWEEADAVSARFKK